MIIYLVWKINPEIIMNKKELEERLIKFAVCITEIVLSISDTKAANHLGGQLMRSGTSPALNYGEAQSAESTKDFIHKLRIVLKELRETNICLKIIHRSKQFFNEEDILKAVQESDELIAIFVTSINTLQQNQASKLRSKL